MLRKLKNAPDSTGELTTLSRPVVELWEVRGDLAHLKDLTAPAKRV